MGQFSFPNVHWAAGVVRGESGSTKDTLDGQYSRHPRPLVFVRSRRPPLSLISPSHHTTKFIRTQSIFGFPIHIRSLPNPPPLISRHGLDQVVRLVLVGGVLGSLLLGGVLGLLAVDEVEAVRLEHLCGVDGVSECSERWDKEETDCQPRLRRN